MNDPLDVLLRFRNVETIMDNFVSEFEGLSAQFTQFCHMISTNNPPRSLDHSSNQGVSTCPEYYSPAPPLASSIGAREPSIVSIEGLDTVIQKNRYIPAFQIKVSNSAGKPCDAAEGSRLRINLYDSAGNCVDEFWNLGSKNLAIGGGGCLVITRGRITAVSSKNGGEFFFHVKVEVVDGFNQVLTCRSHPFSVVCDVKKPNGHSGMASPVPVFSSRASRSTPERRNRRSSSVSSQILVDSPEPYRYLIPEMPRQQESLIMLNDPSLASPSPQPRSNVPDATVRNSALSICEFDEDDDDDDILLDCHTADDDPAFAQLPVISNEIFAPVETTAFQRQISAPQDRVRYPQQSARDTSTVDTLSFHPYRRTVIDPSLHVPSMIHHPGRNFAPQFPIFGDDTEVPNRAPVLPRRDPRYNRAESRGAYGSLASLSSQATSLEDEN